MISNKGGFRWMCFSRNSFANLASQPSYKQSAAYSTFFIAFFGGLASIVLSTQVFFLAAKPRLFERRTFAAEVLLQKRYWRNFSAEVLLENICSRGFIGEEALKKIYCGSFCCRSFTGEEVLEKIYCGSFIGEHVLQKLQWRKHYALIEMFFAEVCRE